MKFQSAHLFIEGKNKMKSYRQIRTQFSRGLFTRSSCENLVGIINQRLKTEGMKHERLFDCLDHRYNYTFPRVFFSPRWNEASKSFFGKAVVSNDALLRHTGERMFCRSRHGIECFPEVDTGERMFLSSKHMKGPMTKDHKWPHSERQALSIGLICFTSLFFANNRYVLVRLTERCWSPLVVTPERNSSKNCSQGSELLVRFL